MKKRAILILAGSIFFISFMIFVKALSVNYVLPTPDNGASNTSIIINVSTDETSEHYIFTDWNQSLIGWWTMDVNSSGGFIDRSLNSNNGTAFNVSQVNNSYWGGGAYFNGSLSNDYVNFGDKDYYDGNNEITISIWEKLEGNENLSHNLVAKASSYNLRTDDTSPVGKIKFGFRPYGLSAASVSTTATYDAYTWHHVVGVYDGSNLKIYVDGNLDNSASATGTIAVTANPLYLGKEGGQQNFNGTLDDLIIFNRALSSQEIKSLYNASANKFDIDFSNEGIAGQNYSYKSYIINKSGSLNSSETRNIMILKGITGYRPYNNRNYVSNSSIIFNVTTNFNSSCSYSFDLGLVNYSMSSSDNLKFNSSNSSLNPGNYSLIFWCNDSSEIVSQTVNFFVKDHLTYFVDKNSALCSNSYDKNYASNESTPLCNISTGLSKASAGDEIFVKYGDYCEGIGVHTYAPNVNGTESSPILVRGEDNANRTILNGTCSPVQAGGIALQGESFWTFRYFFIYNFSSDAMNIHALGNNNSLNISFENITAFRNGYLGQGVQGGANGDGVSFHENCTGVGRWLNLTENYKSGIVDINGAKTEYYDTYIENNEDYGLLFTTSWIGQEVKLKRVTLKNNPYCLRTGANVTAEDLTCINNSRGLFASYHQIAIEAGTTNITRFNVSGTNSSFNSVYVSGANAFLKDGMLDLNVSLVSNSNVTFTNVSYNLSKESVSANSVLIRNFYLEVSSNVEGVNVTITNSSGDIIFSGLTNSNLSIEKQILNSYINYQGTRSYYSNYSINATKSGYVSQNISVNLTENNYITFNLAQIAETPASTSVGSSSTVLSNDQSKSGANAVIYLGGGAFFNVLNIRHSLVLIKLGNNSAEAILYSSPQKVSFIVGEEKKFNMNNDTYYDLSLKLNSVTKYSANFAIKEIHESISVPVVPSTPENKTESAIPSIPEVIETGKNILKTGEFWVGLVILILILALVLFSVRRHRKKRYYRYGY